MNLVDCSNSVAYRRTLRKTSTKQHKIQLRNTTHQPLISLNSVVLTDVDVGLVWNYGLYGNTSKLLSPVSIQTQSIALRALRKWKPQETQALTLASSQSWLPLLRPSIFIGCNLQPIGVVYKPAIRPISLISDFIICRTTSKLHQCCKLCTDDFVITSQQTQTFAQKNEK